MIKKFKFGLPDAVWNSILLKKNKSFEKFGTDFNNDLYHKLYPVQDFNYKFNSWGLRDNIDYDGLYKQKVILCIGDSFTLNVGGPMEYSWPHLLGKKFNLPAINVGIWLLGTESFAPLAEKLRKYFDVQHTFLMYNLHGDFIINNQEIEIQGNLEEKIHILKNYEWVHGANVTFIPPWLWSDSDRKILYSHFPDAHDYLIDIKVNYSEMPFDIFLCIHTERYEEIRKKSWPSIEALYYHLIKYNTVENIFSIEDQKTFNEVIDSYSKRYFYCNRDFAHFSLLGNQMVADYFYNKATKNMIVDNAGLVYR